MAFLRTVTIYLLLIPKIVEPFWPPAYDINLHHEETFEISEIIESDDVKDVYDEDEMLNKKELEKIGYKPAGEDRYYRIHQYVKRQNKKIEKTRASVKYNTKKNYSESNMDVEDAKPWKAGFVDEKENFINDGSEFYFEGEKVNSLKVDKKREELTAKVENYDYNQLKNEYGDEIKKAEKSNETVRYENVKETENAKEAVKNIIETKNCTEEESKGIGAAAVKCLLQEKLAKKQTIQSKFLRIVVIWGVVYVIIAVPLWCQYGWCCCCCRCKFCQPRDTIEEVKTFFAKNPPGTYRDAKGQTFKYQPTYYEVYAQRNLQRAIEKL